MIADGRGRALAFRLAPGQAHELPHAGPLLLTLPRAPQWVVADRGYAAHGFRQQIWGLGAKPAVPAKRNEALVACPAWIIQQPQPSRASVGQAQGVARCGHPLREDCSVLHGRPLSRSSLGLDQTLTGPKAYKEQLNSAHVFDAAVVTRIESGQSFYPAEGYHQDFLARYPNYPYIAINDVPKVEALQTLYPDLYRADPVLVAVAPSTD